MVCSQLKGALLVDRVEQKEDHVLVYLQEVRGLYREEQQMMQSRSFTDRAIFFFFLPTVNEGHTHQPQLRAHPGAPSAEPEAGCGEDL